jgi:hypothetical protein
MSSIIRRIPSTALAFGLYALIVAFAAVVYFFSA